MRDFFKRKLKLERATHTHTHTHTHTTHTQSGDSQGQEAFLVPSADKQTRNYIYIYINLKAI